jgi:hypothetical protein
LGSRLHEQGCPDPSGMGRVSIMNLQGSMEQTGGRESGLGHAGGTNTWTCEVDNVGNILSRAKQDDLSESEVVLDEVVRGSGVKREAVLQ